MTSANGILTTSSFAQESLLKNLSQQPLPYFDNITGYGSGPHNASHLGSNISIGVVLAAIVFVTVGGNTLVLLAVVLERKLRTTTNYFVVSLAIADLLLGLLVLPFSLILQLERKWILGSTFCDVWAATDVLCCTSSIFSLCAISFDRYIGVTRPLEHQVCYAFFHAGYIDKQTVTSFAVMLRFEVTSSLVSFIYLKAD